MSVSSLRSQCCDYIRAHGPEFLPYLTHPDTGNQFTQEQFEEYCREIADTASWGGQLEVCTVHKVSQLHSPRFDCNIMSLCANLVCMNNFNFLVSKYDCICTLDSGLLPYFPSAYQCVPGQCAQDVHRRGIWPVSAPQLIVSLIFCLLMCMVTV